jgi:hypothetical protein
MAKGDIVSVSIRKETEEETELRTWFDKQEAETINNLEAGARQVIQLVTAFYGVLFGVVALGKDKIEASLHVPIVILCAGVAILAMLGALIAALVVVLPAGYRYRPASLSDQRMVYQKILLRKWRGLTATIIAFGLGLAAFAALIATMLIYR